MFPYHEGRVPNQELYSIIKPPQNTSETYAEDTSLFLLPFCGGSFQIFLHPKLHNPADQVVRNRLIQGKLYGTLASLIYRKFLLKLLNAGRHRVKPDMLFERGKMH